MWLWGLPICYREAITPQWSKATRRPVHPTSPPRSETPSGIQIQLSQWEGSRYAASRKPGHPSFSSESAHGSPTNHYSPLSSPELLVFPQPTHQVIYVIRFIRSARHQGFCPLDHRDAETASPPTPSAIPSPPPSTADYPVVNLIILSAYEFVLSLCAAMLAPFLSIMLTLPRVFSP